MIIMQFANALAREIDSDIELFTNSMKRGLDQQEYWETVGVIRGLEAVRAHIIDLASRAERADDN